GHQKGEDQRSSPLLARKPAAGDAAHRHPATHLPSAPQEGDTNPQRHTLRGSRQTDGHPEIRGEGHMNGVLVILEYRGGWNRMSWEALAAGQQIAAQTNQPLIAAVAGSRLNDAALEL